MQQGKAMDATLFQFTPLREGRLPSLSLHL